MTAHQEAMAAYIDRVGMPNRPTFETVSEPEDATAGMGKCNDCTAYRGGWCTTAQKAWGVRNPRVEIGPTLAAMSQHCAGFAKREAA